VVGTRSPEPAAGGRGAGRGGRDAGGDDGLTGVATGGTDETAGGGAVAGWVAVRNTNHFGIAAYHPLQALGRGLIGWAMTNSTRFVAPLWGAQRMLGTNPIAVAFPGRDEPPVVIDLATSAVPYGYGFPLTTLARGSWNDTNGKAALATGFGNAAGGSSGAFSIPGRRDTSKKNMANAASTSIAVENPERAGARGARRRSIARRASRRWRKSADGVIGEAECRTWTA